MKKVFIRAEVECFAQPCFLRAKTYTKTLLRGFQQLASIVAGQAQIGLELRLWRNLFAIRNVPIPTNEIGELVKC